MDPHRKMRYCCEEKGDRFWAGKEKQHIQDRALLRYLMILYEGQEEKEGEIVNLLDD